MPEMSAVTSDGWSPARVSAVIRLLTIVWPLPLMSIAVSCSPLMTMSSMTTSAEPVSVPTPSACEPEMAMLCRCTPPCTPLSEMQRERTSSKPSWPHWEKTAPAMDALPTVGIVTTPAVVLTCSSLTPTCVTMPKSSASVTPRTTTLCDTRPSIVRASMSMPFSVKREPDAACSRAALNVTTVLPSSFTCTLVILTVCEVDAAAKPEPVTTTSSPRDHCVALPWTTTEVAPAAASATTKAEGALLAVWP